MRINNTSTWHTTDLGCSHLLVQAFQCFVLLHIGILLRRLAPLLLLGGIAAFAHVPILILRI
jgi:hypothetical protein